MTKKKASKKKTSKKKLEKRNIKLSYKRVENAKKPAIINNILSLYSNEDFSLKPHHRRAVKTGLFLEIPENHIGIIKDEPELSLVHGITNLNSIIHASDKEVKILLTNLGSEKVKIKKGMKIANLIIQKIEQVNLNEDEVLEAEEYIPKKSLESSDLQEIKDKILSG